jgi:hypothetical protein
MKNLYLILAVLGAVVPYVFFVDFIAANGLSLGAFLSGLFVNGAAGGFSADLLITSLVFWIFMWTRARPRPWLFVLLNLTIRLSCALPAYRYADSRRGSSPASVPGAKLA